MPVMGCDGSCILKDIELSWNPELVSVLQLQLAADQKTLAHISQTLIMVIRC